MKILVVDDSRIMRNIVKNCVGGGQLPPSEFFEAADGRQALEIIEREQLDLVLLDWNMPNLNGIELVKMLRGREKYKLLPIIMITSEAAKYNVIEAVKAGVNDYVIKPVSENFLVEKIKKAKGI
jgi:two-component system chemotaxis response regulator CheY